jgi:hypothetical protein
MAGWTSGRMRQASSIVTAWIVERMSASRTTWWLATRRDSTSGSKSATRDHSPT